MNLEDLGRRAVACKHWRWMGGMAVIDRPMWRVVDRIDLPPYMVRGYEEELLDGMMPDLSDPATLGCLLHLVREAWGSDEWSRSVVPVFNGIDAWTVGCLDMQGRKAPRLLFLVNKITCMPVGIGSSEAEALIIALEAAP